MITYLANLLGTEVAALCIALSLFAGYPLAAVYRLYLYGKEPWLQHAYFSAVGLSLMAFNFGFNVIHSLICICVAYLLANVKQLSGTRYSVGIAYVFYMTYLCSAYFFTATKEYDIKWTIPQCILTLRLIGLIMDIYDGKKPKESLFKEQVETAVYDTPGFLEIAAYTYFYGSFLVGPQYPLTRFRNMVSGKFSDPSSGGSPNCIAVGLWRLTLGCFYMGLYQVLILWIPNSYLTSDQFREGSFPRKFCEVLLWFRVITFMYQSVWLIVEGSCILSGLAYNGVAPNGKIKYDGVRNIRITKFELATSFKTLVESYNCNTNQWAFRYVFKRLRHLGNKTISHILTLLFLAVWHGMATGYYLCFAFEFICVIAERQADELLAKLPNLSKLLSTKKVRFFLWPIKKLLITFGMMWGFISFSLLTYKKYLLVFHELYYCGWIVFCVLWPVTYFIVKKFVLKEQKRNVD